jgi:leucyl aminopeptidase (aminopeptidase T)
VVGDVDKGADVIVTRCLQLVPGESLHLLTWGAAEVADAIARATARAGGKLRRIELEKLDGEGSAPVATGMTGATASVLVAGEGLSTLLRYAVIRAAAHVRARHLHMPYVDARVLSQGARADPDILTKINERVIDLVRPGLGKTTRIHVTSSSGTDLEIGLSPSFTLVSANGRPARGAADNVPSGSVYTYPASIRGTLVVDRGLVGSDVVVTTTLRRHPVTFTFEDGQVISVETDDADLAKQIEEHLAQHTRAGMVGHVTFPTNYLVRSEIGVQVQDNLLPGINVSLGFSASKLTKAPTDAPVQLTLLARRLTVTANGSPLVTDGRFEQRIVEGLDPFR